MAILQRELFFYCDMLLGLSIKKDGPYFANGILWFLFWAEQGIPDPKCKRFSGVVSPLKIALVMPFFLASPIMSGIRFQVF